MCVIAFAWDCHPRWQLLLVGNRDEAHARASAPLARWLDAPQLLAGRDLEAGGTWMGVREPRRVAVVTNVRDPRAARDGASRGLLVSNFLRGDDGAATHAVRLVAGGVRYRPFNLLLFDGLAAWFASNHPQLRTQDIASGVHGVSNGGIDLAWPKTRRVTTALRAWIEAGDESFEPLFDAFADRTQAPDDELPDTGVGLELERLLSPVFVAGERYGTRATTLIALDRAGEGCIIERRFGPGGVVQGQTMLEIDASPIS